MTQPLNDVTPMRLDPYTLRQAAARWPIETLSSRSAQSFLKSLAEEAERDRPALQPQPATIRERLQELLEMAERTDPGRRFVSLDYLNAILDEQP
jgi:hypothetical protein